MENNTVDKARVHEEIEKAIDANIYTFYNVLHFLDENCPERLGIDRKMVPNDHGCCVDSCAMCWLETSAW